MPDSERSAPKNSRFSSLSSLMGGSVPLQGQESGLGRWVLAPFALWAVSALFPPLNHDSAAILFWAQRMVGGERLYIDLVDVNPPMIFWLNLAPAWIAAKTGLPAGALLNGGLLLLIFGSLAYSARLLRRLHEGGGLVWQIATPLAALFVALVYPAHSFAQREHIFLLCALPYLIAAAARSERRRKTGGSAASAVLFALAVCLKPHFAVVPLLIESWILSRQGMRRWLLDPTPWIVGLTGLVYVGIAAWLHPAYFSALPGFLTNYAAIEPGSGWRLLTDDQVPALIVGAVIGGIFAFSLLPSRLAQAISLFVGATTISGLLQAKGWDYHFLAARAGLILLIVGLAASLIDRYGAGLRSGGDQARSLVVGLLMTGLFTLSGALSPPLKLQREFAASQAGRLARLLSTAAPGEPVMWLTGGVYPQFTAMLASGNPVVGHYMSLWLLPTLYRKNVNPASTYHALSEMSVEERALFDSLGEDLKNRSPRLLLVYDADREGSFKDRRFNYLDYALRNPDFAQAFRAYSLFAELDGWKIYRR